MLHWVPNHSGFSTIWPNMDPAHTPKSSFERIEEVLQPHKAVMSSVAAEAKQAAATQEQNLSCLISQVQQLAVAIAQLAPVSTSPEPAQVTISLLPPRSVSESRIGAPERYVGEPEGCNSFLTNCSIFFFFAYNPSPLPQRKLRGSFTINQLAGRARL